MYWTYLLNSESMNVLTFESFDKSRHDLEKMIDNYTLLIEEKFFESFKDYDMLLICEYGPDEKPLERKKTFLTNITK